MSPLREPVSPLREEFRALARLAAPVVLAQLGWMAMGTVDVALLGRYSTDALAAGGLANGLWILPAVFCMGTLFVLDPVVAQAVGAKDERGVGVGLQRGVVLAVALSVPATLLALLFPEAALRAMRQPETLVPDAAAYVRIAAIGYLPLFLFTVLRQTLQALGQLRPVLWTLLVANVLNLVLDYGLIFGRLGLPELGVAGSAWASSICRVGMVVVLIWLAWPELGPRVKPLLRSSLAPRPLLALLAVGVPVGVQQFLEVAAFAWVNFAMGGFGEVQIAAHQVAIALAATTFMVPLGIGAAAAVRVGYGVGRGDQDAVKRSARVALAVGTGVMAVSALLFLSLPETLASLLTDRPDVLAVAVLLVPVAGAFQLFDGIQVVALGVLRGAADTRVPMLINLVGYWAVGFPVGLWLAFHTDVGPAGLWWGLVAGLGTVALVLLARMRHRFARGVARLDVERGS